MAVNDRMIRRRPVKPGPVKPKPSKGKNPQLPYRKADPGFGPKKRTPGKGNPPVDKTLPRRYDPGFGPKKPGPVKPKPKGGGIRDLLFRKPKSKQDQMIERGQISIMRRPKLNNEKARKDNSPKKLPTPIKIDKKKMAEESYKNYLKQRGEKIRKADGSVLKGLEKLKKAPRPTMNKDFRYLNMMGPAGPAPKRDNSAVTYSTRVKPKFPSMMEGPYRIKKATVKTGRGR